MNVFSAFVAIPQSLVDQMKAKGLNVNEALKVLVDGKPVAYNVDVVSDDYFSDFYS